MTTWKVAALSAALVGAVGAGAAVSPVAHGQSTRVVTPRAVQVFSGSGSRIGVSIGDVDASDAKAAQAGVVVEEVVDDSPAQKAGVKKGDVIVEFDGERVRSARQFSRLVQETVPGRKVQTVVLRDGQRTPLTIEPQENDGARLFRDGRFMDELSVHIPPPPPIPSRPAAPAPPAPPMLGELENFVWFSGSTLGMTTNDLSPQLADYFGSKDGVLVTSVQDDSAAAKAGLKAGDVITAINGDTVGRPADLRRNVQRLSSGDEFTLMVVRDKKPLTLKGKVEDRRDRRRTYRS
jgi:serine protease Do